MKDETQGGADPFDDCLGIHVEANALRPADHADTITEFSSGISMSEEDTDVARLTSNPDTEQLGE